MSHTTKLENACCLDFLGTSQICHLSFLSSLHRLPKVLPPGPPGAGKELMNSETFCNIVLLLTRSTHIHQIVTFEDDQSSFTKDTREKAQGPFGFPMPIIPSSVEIRRHQNPISPEHHVLGYNIQIDPM